jgi:hypothetical protein
MLYSPLRPAHPPSVPYGRAGQARGAARASARTPATMITVRKGLWVRYCTSPWGAGPAGAPGRWGRRAAGLIYMLVLGAVRPRAIENAVANLEGEVEAASAAL